MSFEEVREEIEGLRDQHANGLLTDREYVLKAIDVMQGVTIDDVPFELQIKMLDVLADARLSR